MRKLPFWLLAAALAACGQSGSGSFHPPLPASPAFGLPASSCYVTKQAPKNVIATITFYGWPDNDPPGRAIAHPVIHNGASGDGTWCNPTTFATERKNNAQIPYGMKIYVPFLKQYFVREDDCAPSGPTVGSGNNGCYKLWFDLWIGGDRKSKTRAVVNCENAMTPNAKVRVVLDPAANLPVAHAGAIYQDSPPPNGSCYGKPENDLRAHRAAAQNAIFLDHGFDVTAVPDAKIRSVVNWLAARRFTIQLHNLTAFHRDGTMDPANYSHLANWIAVSRAQDPNQQIVAYLSGSLAMVEDSRTWPKIAAVCRTLARRYGVDGVNLDFEPYRSNEIANYRGLFTAVRDAIGPSVQLSLDYTADPSAQWPPAAFRSLTASIDVVMPMLYDSSCRTARCYERFVRSAVAYQYANEAPSARLVPLFPTYARSATHDPDVETIAAAAAAVRDLIRSGRAAVPGAGVWWYYGWNGAAERDWRGAWGLNT